MNHLKLMVSIFAIINIMAVAGFLIYGVVAAEETEVFISPLDQDVSSNSNFEIDVYCSPGQPIKAFELKFSFDASLIQVDGVTEGNIFNGYETFFNSGTINNNEGTVIDVYCLIMGAGNVTGNGTLVSINLTSLTSSGVSGLNLYEVGVTNETQYVPIVVTNGSVQIISTLPEISNIGLDSSEPLDIDSSFGWANVSCEVTDEDGVDEVYLNITNPDDSYNNVSMLGDGNYYYNSSSAFSTVGNYSYHIWASDNLGNNVDSSTFYFSMPPNWDIDKNGWCKVFDLTMISNHYNESGDNGWIREDVDNDGEVNMVDFLAVYNHYNENWWT